jgi:hypothetical protein
MDRLTLYCMFHLISGLNLPHPHDPFKFLTKPSFSPVDRNKMLIESKELLLKNCLGFIPVDQ